MKNIILTGFMGTGKTSAARELASLLGMEIVDMDSEIEKERGMSINEIFERDGEAVFRDLETAMAEKVAELNGRIISTGGGVVLRRENIAVLGKNGVIVCLTAPPDTILERTGESDDRPLLNVEDPLRKISELLEYRRPFYENADLVVDTAQKTPRQVAEEIIERLNWKR